IHEEAEVILNERPLHMREVVGDHKQDAERPANPDHEPENQRQSDQQMTPLHQEIGQGQHRWRRKEGEEAVEGHDVVEKTARAVILQDLPTAGVKKEPAHEDAQEKDDSAIQICFSHSHSSLRKRSRVVRLVSSFGCAFGTVASCLRTAPAAASPNSTLHIRLTGYAAR